jgi:hypothetical protein
MLPTPFPCKFRVRELTLSAYHEHIFDSRNNDTTRLHSKLMYRF